MIPERCNSRKSPFRSYLIFGVIQLTRPSPRPKLYRPLPRHPLRFGLGLWAPPARRVWLARALCLLLLARHRGCDRLRRVGACGYLIPCGHTYRGRLLIHARASWALCHAGAAGWLGASGRGSLVAASFRGLTHNIRYHVLCLLQTHVVMCLLWRANRCNVCMWWSGLAEMRGCRAW